MIALGIIAINIEHAYALGSTGWYATKIKLEYQYSDYNSYQYPALELDDSIKFQYLDPYIRDFPEHRSLVRVVQSFGPTKSLELKHEYSALTLDKSQNRYYTRYDTDVGDLTTFYGAAQAIGVGYDDPDSSRSGGYMAALGLKHDRSGWIKAEGSLSFDYNRASNRLLTQTWLPMLQCRWSVNSVTALSTRWDGYFAANDSGSVPSHAITVFVSRYLPTRTAVHIFTRYFWADYGLESLSPAIEVAQYLRWNLTARLTYRYYRNWFDPESAPDFIEGASLSSHSVRAYLEWLVRPGLQLNLKLRRYVSDQDIRMNTYLLGVEWEI